MMRINLLKPYKLRNYIEARQLKAIQEDSMTLEFITWLAWAMKWLIGMIP